MSPVRACGSWVTASISGSFDKSSIKNYTILHHTDQHCITSHWIRTYQTQDEYHFAQTSFFIIKLLARQKGVLKEIPPIFHFNPRVCGLYQHLRGPLGLPFERTALCVPVRVGGKESQRERLCVLAANTDRLLTDVGCSNEFLAHRIKYLSLWTRAWAGAHFQNNYCADRFQVFDLLGFIGPQLPLITKRQVINT